MTLAVNQLIGFGAFTSTPLGPATKTFRSSQASSANATTYDSTTHWTSITVDPTDTFVVVGIFQYHTSVAKSVSSVTVTGDVSGAHSASAAADPGAASLQYAGIFVAPISGDSSVDIDFTLSGAAVRAAIFVWSGKDMALTASASNTSDTTSPYSATITTPSGGLGFAVAYEFADANIAWTNYVEDGEQSIEGPDRVGAASISGSDSTGPTATVTGSSGGRLAVATFGPG